jgi:selenide, water dikinase
MPELAQVLRHVKVASTNPAVLVGLEAPDDAGVYQLAPDLAMVQSVDFFTPIVDDPFDWGRIAAANALSDIYAMGAQPISALNLVGWPRELDFELLGRVLEGGSAVCEQAGVSVIGGHSIDDPEPKFGLAVTGTVHPDRIVTTAGAQPDANLVLTKPLGMGVISTAIKGGRASDEVAKRAVEVMTRLNRDAAQAMLEVGVEAATDVTGFGLLGHLREMLDSDLDAHLDSQVIPIVEGAWELADEGHVPGGTTRNIEALRDVVETSGLDEASATLLFDAQTSGGLLIAVAPSKTESLLRSLSDRGVSEASLIGELSTGSGRIKVSA